MAKIILFIWFALLISPFINYSQTDSSKYIINRKLLSVQDGLASNEVLCGMQDSKGFLWFGTRNGLNRYDGKNFILFTKQKNNMRENKVIQMAEDGGSNLWLLYGTRFTNMGSLQSVDILNLNTNTVSPIDSIIKNIPFKDGYIRWIQPIENNEIMIITQSFETWIYNTFSGFRMVFTIKMKYDFNPATSYFSKNIVMLHHYGFGNEYESSHSNPFFVDMKDSIYCPLLYKGDTLILFTRKHTIIKMINNSVLIADKNNSHPDFTIINAYDYSSKGVLFTNADYLSYYNGDEIINLINRKTNSIGNNVEVYVCFTDRSDNKWICTTAGLWKVKVAKNKFVHYFSSSQTNIKENTFNNQARSIYADIAGSSGYVYANIWNKFFISPIDTPSVNRYCDMKSIAYGLCKFKNNIYSGTFGLSEYNCSTKQFKIVLNNNPVKEIWSLFPLNDSILLGGGTSGIEQYNVNSKTATVKFTNEAGITPFLYKFIRENTNTLWLLTETCIYKMDNNINVKEYWSNEKKLNGNKIPFSNFKDMYIDSAGIFWITTSGEGLWSWNRTTNIFHQYTIADGLPTNLLYCLKEDKQNNLWISSDLGLICFNKKDLTVHTYTTADGLSNNEFNRTSAYQAADGRMYFGGLNGINAFYPEDFTSGKSQVEIPIRVISVSQFSAAENKLVDNTHNFLKNNIITLSPGDRFATLEFMLLDYDDGKKRYAYQIEGLDKDWNYTYDNEISLSGLPYGKYVLSIKGQFANGQWSKSELKIPINVITPFYKQWWFVFLVFIVGTVFVFLIFYVRTKRLVKAKEMLEHTVIQRTTELKNALGERELLLKEIHHRVKNNLQVISGLLELQKEEMTDDAVKAAFNEGQSRVRSVALIHQNLYQQDNLSSIQFKLFISDLVKYLADVFEEKNNFMTVEVTGIDEEFDIDTAVPLGLIINELLTNAYKYVSTSVKNAKVVLQLSKMSDNEYELIYSDNGAGIKDDINFETAHSLGMRLIKGLIAQLGGTVVYKYNKGSVFIIQFKNSEARRKE